MKYVAAGAESLPFADSAFDVVASFNSLDHVEDLGRATREIVRVTTPGGTCLLLTEIHGEPTVCEPVVFSWDVVDMFAPELRPVDVRRFEKSGTGMYESILAGVPFDDHNPRSRYGVLLARFEKRQAGRHDTTLL